jgi:tryptophanyl-tRNA synthetase
MTRNFAERFNSRYGEVFPLPKAFSYGGALTKIMSLDASGKMSKSENHMVTLYLADDDKLIREKIKKAKSDMAPTEPNAPKTPAVENLFSLMRLVSEKEVVEKFEADYNSCVIRYGDMKGQLGEDMVKFIAPLREKAKAYRNDEKYLRDVMALGAEKARKSAKATLELVRNAMGLEYFAR